MAVYRLPHALLLKTFEVFRACGNGRRECQVLWIGPWSTPDSVTEVIHPVHASHAGGFALDDRWLTAFWLDLAKQSKGVRVQVHTHPGSAFHSSIDDQYPIVNTSGFLSLVLPRFALGPVGFAGACLAEIQNDGNWAEVPIRTRIQVVP